MTGAGNIVLIVDDDELVLRAVGGMVRRGGYTPVLVSAPLDALEKSRDFKIEIRLLLADLMMPQMDGLTLAQQVLSARPGICVLLMSGKSGVFSPLPMIRKPFSTAHLLAQISKVINSPPPVASGVFAPAYSERAGTRARVFTEELEEARGRYLEASREFLSFAKEIPSDLPHPDGVTRIQFQAEARKQAYEESARARNRLDEPLASEGDPDG